MLQLKDAKPKISSASEGDALAPSEQSAEAQERADDMAQAICCLGHEVWVMEEDDDEGFIYSLHGALMAIYLACFDLDVLLAAALAKMLSMTKLERSLGIVASPKPGFLARKEMRIFRFCPVFRGGPPCPDDVCSWARQLSSWHIAFCPRWEAHLQLDAFESTGVACAAGVTGNIGLAERVVSKLSGLHGVLLLSACVAVDYHAWRLGLRLLEDDSSLEPLEASVRRVLEVDLALQKVVDPMPNSDATQAEVAAIVKDLLDFHAGIPLRSSTKLVASAAREGNLAVVEMLHLAGFPITDQTVTEAGCSTPYVGLATSAAKFVPITQALKRRHIRVALYLMHNGVRLSFPTEIHLFIDLLWNSPDFRKVAGIESALDTAGVKLWTAAEQQQIIVAVALLRHRRRREEYSDFSISEDENNAAVDFNCKRDEALLEELLQRRGDFFHKFLSDHELVTRTLKDCRTPNTTLPRARNAPTVVDTTATASTPYVFPRRWPRGTMETEKTQIGLDLPLVAETLTKFI